MLKKNRTNIFFYIFLTSMSLQVHGLVGVANIGKDDQGFSVLIQLILATRLLIEDAMKAVGNRFASYLMEPFCLAFLLLKMLVSITSAFAELLRSQIF
jgi:hypothetical protein